MTNRHYALPVVFGTALFARGGLPAKTPRMSVDPQTLLDNVEAAINGLLTALADCNVQEYQLPDGRKVQRVEFATSLNALRTARTELKREVGRKATSPVRIGKLGRRHR